MSYSRWSNSCWYCYYCSSSGYDTNSQVFELCTVSSFTYEELKEDIQACLNRAQEKQEATPAEMKELKGYMLNFMADVESDIGLKYCEELKNLDVSNISEILDWLHVQESNDKYRREGMVKSGFRDIGEDEKITAFNEALKVIYAEPDTLPLLMSEIKTDMGKLMLEKRLKDPVRLFENMRK